MSTLIARIDIGGRDNNICALSDQREVVAPPQRFAHTRTGNVDLTELLVTRVA